MSRLLCLVGAFCGFFALGFAQNPAAPAPASLPLPRERLLFDAGWRFTKGDPAGVEAGAQLDYAQLRDWLLPTAADFLYYEATPPRRPAGPGPGADLAYVQPGFDDSGWRALDLPHDWGIEGPFDQNLPGETGKLPWAGVGWYRKSWDAPASDASRQVYLDVDGAMSYATIWLNGQLVGGWPFGYSSFRVDLTPYLRPGARNVLAIRLEPRAESSRWYPGAGLYRHVWLVKTAPIHVAHWGTFITTPHVSAESADVDVQVRLANRTGERVEVSVGVELFAATPDGRPTGAPVATAEAQSMRIAAQIHMLTSFPLTVAQPRRWDLATPDRYVAVTTVKRGDAVLDRHETPFGIRSIAVDPQRGFLLNDRVVELFGVCQHHDLGALGAAINERALERQLEILRAMGTNAIRTSHNPPAPELLELCDRMGLLVMDETFDAWAKGKKPDDYNRFFADWHEADTRALVRRDRNHPSVVMWSIGNEIREQETTEGWKVAARLAGLMREEDRTRPITAGFNAIWSGYMGFQTAVDITGYNYKPGEYAKFIARHPHRAVLGAETASTISSRGEYFFPVVNDKAQGQSDFQMSSYDLYTPRWAHTPDTEWEALDRHPRVLGEFVWTGFDYLGEPTPYNSDATNILNYADPAERARAAQELAALGKIRVPSRSSYFGIIDLAGFPKDRFYLYQSRWRPELKMAHLLPHWNWPERVGQVTPVHVYTSGDEAELFLNGRSLGRQKRGEFQYRFRWDDVVYEPGELKVVTWKAGQPWAEAVRRTTGAASQLLLAPDRATIRADGRDLSFVTVTIADAQNELVPRAKPLMRFRVSGPGTIVATDNGDATDHTVFASAERRAFNGLALAIVRAHPGQPGAITLHAESDGLPPASVTLRAE